MVADNVAASQGSCPLPKRRAVHTPSAGHPSDGSSGEMTNRAVHHHLSTARKFAWVGGAGIAAVAVAIPAVSFAAPKATDTQSLQNRSVPADGWDSSDFGSGSVPVAMGLNGYEGAASRAKLRTPIAVSQCVQADAPANGSRAITQQSVVYWPLRQGSYTESSPFGWRVSPVSGQMLLHEGIDMAAALGEPIYAAADGKVVEVSENSHSGAFVTIEHQTAGGEKYTTSYLHQYLDQILVHTGDSVKAGQQIGQVGSNGWSTGAHLHFEVRNAQNEPIEPTAFMQKLGAVFIGENCS